MTKTVYTADEEEPKCGECDNICESDEFCIKWCGAEHGWHMYSRTEIKEEEEA